MKSILESNEELEKEIITLKQYTRIGNTRAQLQMKQIEHKIAANMERTQHQLKNPPFTVPEIVMPKFQPLSTPPGISRVLEHVAMRAIAY